MFVRTTTLTPEFISRGDEIVEGGEIALIQDVKIMKGNTPGTGIAYVSYNGEAHPVNLAARFAVVSAEGETEALVN